MDPSLLLKKHAPGDTAYTLLLEHGHAVAAKSLAIAERLADPSLDFIFLEQAAILHDIGVTRVYAPTVGCHGQLPYICHGIVGREILDEEGYPSHALVCERHIGVGLTVADILRQGLPLPVREMIPVTMTERIVCFADLFFSKKPGAIDLAKTADEVRRKLFRYGDAKVALFDQWCVEFGEV